MHYLLAILTQPVKLIQMFEPLGMCGLARFLHWGWMAFSPGYGFTGGCIDLIAVLVSFGGWRRGNALFLPCATSESAISVFSGT